MSKVLIVDDEKNITLVIQAMLAREGVEGAVFNDSTRALHELDSSRGSLRYSAVITDLYMPGLGGMDLLEHCKKHFPQLPVIIITAFGTVEAAVAALKKGAFDFVTKPFDQTDLLNSVRKAILTSDQEKRGPGPTTIAWSAPDASPIIGRGAQMQEVFRVISKIAASPSSVLVWGESGTGKELIALDIHKNSDRAKKPFIKINCAAIPSTLIESELFGYEKGAFTGAVTSKPGRFELAHEGTLFLDEVAEMPLEMQVKLLRALQEHEFERVGGISTIRVDVRIIAATNKDLEAEVKSGKFREDLYYRLNVVPIRLPPLRDRPEDIDELVHYFVREFNPHLKKNVVRIKPECIQALGTYAWPGNIRQLENVIERSLLMCEGDTLTLSDLPPEILSSGGPQTSATIGDSQQPTAFKEIVKKQTQSVERDLIEKALEETDGNVTRAAEKLGLSRKGLQLKMKELGLKSPRSSSGE